MGRYAGSLNVMTIYKSWSEDDRYRASSLPSPESYKYKTGVSNDWYSLFFSYSYR